ncbi:hypothetical protein M433DRAFT_2097 [Acidomyces richmondensis BFW]|nr:MAG: hypothetical protein FE78DRAFT_27420 [Acidomyces sp. 'richmondensis']KYG48319.1 hypothetical protein M433DRAFT_2097 [Acidomyces richmondensis BFW]
MAHPSPNPFRIYILTASVAAITATGAWYGAGLKTRQEFRRDRRTILETSPAKRIEEMEAFKALLLQRKAELQAKIDHLAARNAKKMDQIGPP